MVGGSEGCDVEAAIAAMEAPGPALEKLEEGLLEGDAEAVLRKKRLLFRTVYLAHKFGNPSYMTEVVGRQVGSCLGLSISLTMFPTTAMISFHEKSAVMHHTVTESYSFAVEQGLHAHSLTELTRLIAALRKGLVNLDEMEHQIARLERPRPIYSWYFMLLAYMLVGGTSTVIFYDGAWRDALISALLSSVVYFIGACSVRFRGVGELECFLSSFLVTCLASLVDMYVVGPRGHSHSTCLYAVTFGSIVWLLPGLSICMALQELYQKMIVVGSSRLLYGLLQLFQLAYGVAFAFTLVEGEGVPESQTNGCQGVVAGFQPVEWPWLFFLLPLNSIGFAVITKAHPRQWFGMVLVSGAGASVNLLLANMTGVKAEAVPLLAALAVGIVARLFTFLFAKGSEATAYNYVGCLLLVPGGLGVRGVSALVTGSVIGGTTLILNTMGVAVCVALGLFISKMPSKHWHRGSKGFSTRLPPLANSRQVPTQRNADLDVATPRLNGRSNAPTCPPPASRTASSRQPLLN